MICDLCGNEGAEMRRITRSYGQGANLLVIENIPMIRCTRCGESYLTAETLHEIDRIKQQRQQIAVIRLVAVADWR
jgi:YgiT-type zinc finger domain-containing protein